MKKNLTPNQTQLNSLKLNKGINKLEFRTAQDSYAETYIYLIDQKTKLVVSDIDGTITKSDVMGQILTNTGLGDWAHKDVCNLFTNIANNAYQFVYITARSIKQSTKTKEYIRQLKQNDVLLPDGPVMTTPDGLTTSFYREVIDGKPETFKIPFLQSIEKLFPQNPFYAAFGNKITDDKSYKEVKIANERIFTVNTSSEVTILSTQEKTNYGKLVERVNSIFPKSSRRLRIIK